MSLKDKFAKGKTDNSIHENSIMSFETLLSFIKQGGRFLIACTGESVQEFEEVDEDQYLLTIREFIELAREANHSSGQNCI